jgi:endonuclease/exonuclease/phosphatase family metal-dependent hydrolase
VVEDGVVPTLRVMTYNVRSMRDDREALGRVIRCAEPDVVLVQESPRFARWRSLCAELARRSNLVVVSGGRYAGSNLILSSLAVDVVATHDVLFTADPGLHRRGTAIAVLAKQGTRFAVAGTHLDLKPAARLRHVGELEAALERHVPRDTATIVGGDVNDRPGSAAWTALGARRRDSFAVAGSGNPLTSPARAARTTIDGIFVDPRIAVRGAWVLDQPDVLLASDHRPVVADLELPPAN